MVTTEELFFYQLLALEMRLPVDFETFTPIMGRAGVLTYVIGPYSLHRVPAGVKSGHTSLLHFDRGRN